MLDFSRALQVCGTQLPVWSITTLFRLLLVLGTIKYKEEGNRYHLSCVHPAE